MKCFSVAIQGAVSHNTVNNNAALYAVSHNTVNNNATLYAVSQNTVNNNAALTLSQNTKQQCDTTLCPRSL